MLKPAVVPLTRKFGYTLSAGSTGQKQAGVQTGCRRAWLGKGSEPLLGARGSTQPPLKHPQCGHEDPFPLSPASQPWHGRAAQPQFPRRSFPGARLPARKAVPCPWRQEDTSIRLTMLRQESRLNPSVFRSLSEEEEEEGIRASKHNMGPRGTQRGRRAALTPRDDSVQDGPELEDADFHVLQQQQQQR